MFERTILRNPFIPKKLPPCEAPFPHAKQARFLAYGGREALFGGAVGGGKSAALLAAALQYVEVPGYEAILCRRVQKHLTQADGLIPKFHEWMRICGQTKSFRWNGSDRKATWPNGASLTFGFCDHERHLDFFQGGRWHFAGVDELGQWKKEFYTYLFSRMRKAKELPVPIRMRASANPGGPAHEWIKKRFIAKGAPKYFVPSLLTENPGIDSVDYIQGMAELEAMVRAQLVQGDWSAFFGGRFQGEWLVGKDGTRGWRLQTNRSGVKTYHWPGCPPGGVPLNLTWTAITCDPASRAEEVNDPTAIGVFAVMPHGEILILDVVREWLQVQDIVPRIAGLCLEHLPNWVGIEDSGFQVTLINEARQHPNIPTVVALQPEGKSKLVRARPAIIRTSNGEIYLPADDAIIAPWKDDFVAELVQFTGDEKLDAHDDQVDVFAYFVQQCDRGAMLLPALITPQQAQREANGIGHGGIFLS